MPKQEHTDNRYKTLGAPLLSQHLAYHQCRQQCSTRCRPTRPLHARRSRTHQVTDLLHFQSHVPLQGLILLPLPATGPLNNESWQQLAAHIRKEQKLLRQLRLLIEQAEDWSSTSLRKRQTTAGTTKPGKRNHLRYDIIVA